MNHLPRQKLKEIIIQHGRYPCDNPQRCEAFLRDYCGQYEREIFLIISALKQNLASSRVFDTWHYLFLGLGV